jgi:hypothetical protein
MSAPHAHAAIQMILQYALTIYLVTFALLHDRSFGLLFLVGLIVELVRRNVFL